MPQSSASNALVFSVCQLAFWSSSVEWRLFPVFRVQHQALRDETCDGRCCSCRRPMAFPSTYAECSVPLRNSYRYLAYGTPLLGQAEFCTFLLTPVNSHSPRIWHSLVRRRSRQTIQMSRLKAVSTAESTSRV